MAKYWVDPPSGRQYGFPKIYDDEVEELPFGEAWLLANGMPPAYCGLGCRMWSVEGETDEKETTKTKTT